MNRCIHEHPDAFLVALVFVAFCAWWGWLFSDAPSNRVDRP